MTASSFSRETVLQAFREQYEASETLFKNLREQLILQVSETIKPLVAFLEQHECDECEILEAIFEAITYEKDAELELGTFAFDQRNEWADQCDDTDADEQSQVLYKLGMELLREFKMHRLYQNGFLPYQFTLRHGRDLLINRLNVPEIMQRDQTFRAANFNALEFGKMPWTPVLTVCDTSPKLQPKEALGVQPLQVETRREISVRTILHDFEEELRRMFNNLQQPEVSVKLPGQSHVKLDLDERSKMTPDELNEWYAKMLWAKEVELKRGVSIHPNREMVDLVYRAKVLGDDDAVRQLEDHISKTIQIVEEQDGPPA